MLVTGGAGYIGSHACKALALAGYTPVAYDNLVYGHREAVRWGPLEPGDIADRKRLDAVVAQYQPEAVLHFAAYAYVGESVQDPAKYYRNNVAGTLTLLEALVHHDIRRIVFSSTCATYGVPERTPIDEDHPQQPINPYGASKLMIERMLQDFDAAYGLRSVSLRYFNAAGADPDGEIGEDHDPETHLIPLALQAALGQREALQVFGSDYPTPDGSCIRDYIHVTDLAQAHVLALDYLTRGGATTALNLGTGHGHSVLEVIAAADAVTGRAVPTVLAPRRPGDPPVLTAVADRARQVLGWQPRYTDLATILRHAWNWHRDQPHRPDPGFP
ncbi:UDP-glucose 4-epimerase [Thioalkalivibrio paradoxus ARh 1]|uniref:UDP-glucose 4-epimerase n=1 Tax=Thioalkalivibrio paradoxus ARh 1 TaxID=713585 RepID=W0DIW7_9GAMM|nr:UDP-glucose 4-epimerase [Thioalkalivibrio paradoxus ARh 1]